MTQALIMQQQWARLHSAPPPSRGSGRAPAAGRRPCPAAPAHPKTLQPTNPFTKVDAHLLQDGIPVRATQHARPDDHRRPLRALQPV